MRKSGTSSRLSFSSRVLLYSAAPALFAACAAILAALTGGSGSLSPGARSALVALSGLSALLSLALGFRLARTMGRELRALARVGLKGIYAADDGQTLLGIADALERSGRRDIIVSASGACSIGLDLVGKGLVDSITYQSPEGDGALALKAAADWFSGLELDPLIYLPYEIVTKDNLSNYLPAQW